ncbi:alanine racemase [Aciduricibacillus chroicocephali]|uniref:Alanine racemase n=1 Tax=Aciduricibacillus chroicocephali TaxID=3054939 RepID=A0ABY9KWV5_9BACI|nr:alanine racemase [Bacillaceae bacterium 44XB]
MNSGQYRPSWAEIDLASIKYNIHQIKETLKEENKIMAVVKANGYGHGAVQVAKAAIEAGAEAIAVALLEEAMQLRKAGIEVPVLVLGRVMPEFAPIASENNIALTVFQIDWIAEAERYLDKASDTRLDIHLELDTGMNRTGIKNETDLNAFLQALTDCRRIYLSGVYTHFATADEEQTDYYMRQIDDFRKFADIIKKVWPSTVSWHTSNSAASMHYPHDAADYVRFGVSMYGLYPSPYLAEQAPIELKPAFSLHSRLVEVKQINKGDAVSYGRTYEAEGEEWIGTVPIGYADGWLRRLQGAEVLINGKRMPIVGRICMDQFMVKLDREYQVGEKVTLIGKQGQDEITMQETADLLETIVYEVPCIISSRVPRLYI